ncbi:MAG TPA: hypothetical protein VE153_22870 [Myxococcus sp.]|nr:hypothetical protein [Myxococcus sp.]
MRGVLLAVAAVLLVGAAPPAPVKDKAPPAEPPRFAWPRMQVLEHVEASEIVEAGGIPVALRAVVVKEKLPELIQKLADAFRDGGLYVPPGPAQPQLASGVVMLTAADRARKITYTAILQPQPDGTTALYLGEANHALKRDPAAEGDFAPLPPGARNVLRVGSEGSRTLTFSTPLAGAEVASFYAEALKSAGWRHAEEDEAGVYTRSGEEVRVVHQPGEGGLTSVVLVYRGVRAPR